MAETEAGTRVAAVRAHRRLGACLLMAALLVLGSRAAAGEQPPALVLEMPAKSVSPLEIVTAVLRFTPGDAASVRIDSANVYIDETSGGAFVGATVFPSQWVTFPVTCVISSWTLPGPQTVVARVVGTNLTSGRGFEVTTVAASSLQVNRPAYDISIEAAQILTTEASANAAVPVSVSLRYDAPSQDFSPVWVEVYLNFFPASGGPATSLAGGGDVWVLLHPQSRLALATIVRLGREAPPGRYSVFATGATWNWQQDAVPGNNCRGALGVVTLRDSAANLRVTSLTVDPRAVRAAGTLPVAFEVGYDTALSREPPLDYSVDFRLMPHPVFSLNRGIHLGTADVSRHLPGSLRAGFARLQVPAEARPGSYYVSAQIRPDGSRRDSDSRDDVRLDPRPVQVLPSGIDFAVSSVTAAIPTTSTRSLLPVSATVEYQAPPESAETVDASVSFFLTQGKFDPETSWPLGDVEATLHRGLRQAVGGTFRIPPGVRPGAYEVGASLWPRCFECDANQSNNLASSGSAQGVTLVAGVDVALVSATLSANETPWGSPVTLLADLRCAASDAGQPPITVLVTATLLNEGGEVLADLSPAQTSVLLDPNRSTQVSLSVPTAIVPGPGRYLIRATVRLSDGVDEIDLANNTRFVGPFEVKPVKDDHADSPSTVRADRDVLIADGREVDGVLERPGDADVLLIDIPSPCNLALRLQAHSPGRRGAAELLLQDRDGRSVLAGPLPTDDAGLASLRPSKILSSGRYYVTVRSNWSSPAPAYTVGAKTFTADVELAGISVARTMYDSRIGTANLSIVSHSSNPWGYLARFELFLSGGRRFCPLLDRPVWSGSSYFGWQPGAQTLEAGWYIPDEIPAGDYRLVARVTSDDVLLENGERGKVFQGPVIQVGGPAWRNRPRRPMELLSFDLSPTTLSPRATFEATASVLIDYWNPADVPRVTFYLSSDETLVRTSALVLATREFSPEVSGRVAFHLSAQVGEDTPPGSYRLLCEADWVGEDASRGAAWRVAASPIPVQITGNRVDLSIESATVTQGAVEAADGFEVRFAARYSVPAGRFGPIDAPVRAWAERVDAGGPEGAVPIGVVDGVLLSLAAGETRSDTIHIPLPSLVPGGRYRAHLSIDPGGLVRDADRTNNSLVVTSPVQVYSDSPTLRFASFELQRTRATAGCQLALRSDLVDDSPDNNRNERTGPVSFSLRPLDAEHNQASVALRPSSYQFWRNISRQYWTPLVPVDTLPGLYRVAVTLIVPRPGGEAMLVTTTSKETVEIAARKGPRLAIGIEPSRPTFEQMEPLVGVVRSRRSTADDDLCPPSQLEGDVFLDRIRDSGTPGGGLFLSSLSPYQPVEGTFAQALSPGFVARPGDYRLCLVLRGTEVAVGPTGESRTVTSAGVIHICSSPVDLAMASTFATTSSIAAGRRVTLVGNARYEVPSTRYGAVRTAVQFSLRSYCAPPGQALTLVTTTVGIARKRNVGPRYYHDS